MGRFHFCAFTRYIDEFTNLCVASERIAVLPAIPRIGKINGHVYPVQGFHISECPVTQHFHIRIYLKRCVGAAFKGIFADGTDAVQIERTFALCIGKAIGADTADAESLEIRQTDLILISVPAVIAVIHGADPEMIRVFLMRIIDQFSRTSVCAYEQGQICEQGRREIVQLIVHGIELFGKMCEIIRDSGIALIQITFQFFRFLHQCFRRFFIRILRIIHHGKQLIQFCSDFSELTSGIMIRSHLFDKDLIQDIRLRAGLLQQRFCRVRFFCFEHLQRILKSCFVFCLIVIRKK